MVGLLLPVPASIGQEPVAQPGANLQINVNRVLVPVVVRDAQGNPVTGLTRDDFEVLDNDKPRPLSGFSVETSREQENVGAVSAPNLGPSARNSGAPSSSTKGSPGALPDRITVLLIDDLHLNPSDLAQARNAADKMLPEMLGGADVAAVVALSGQGNSGLTWDPAKLHATLAALQTQGLFRTSAADCPSLDYYQADQIANKHNSVALQDATMQVLNCNPGIDPKADPELPVRLADSAARRVVTLGEQDAQVTLKNMTEIVRRLASMPGQRTVIWVSSGFLPIAAEARAAESRLMDLAAQSDIVIDSLDARGLYTTNLAAGDDVHVVMDRSHGEYREQAMKNAEESMGEIADGTGGSFFHNSNDLETGLRRLAARTEVLYLLELPLEGVKANGAYHRLKVKVDRAGCHLTWRRGYVVAKPEKTRK